MESSEDEAYKLMEEEFWINGKIEEDYNESN
jgi:hypothetical protein